MSLISSGTLSFPSVSCRKGDPLPSCESLGDAKGLTGHIQAHPSDWLAPSARINLLTQRLFQAEGYSMTLLMIDDEDAGEDLEL
jgi:hypothetical protein